LTAGDVYRALWRHKFFIALLTAAFVGATWYVTERQTKTYEASALIRVQQRGPKAGDAAAALQASQTLAQSYAEIIGSGALKPRISSLVAGRVAAGTVSEVVVSASPVQDLDLLSISARSRNPVGAMVVANAVPRALRAFIRSTGSPSERIVTAKAATTPSTPVSRHLALNLALAFMLGLIFNGALALLLELFRDRLPQPDELGQAVGHPVLATIPTLRHHRIAPGGTGEREHSRLPIDPSLDGERDPQATGPRMGAEQ
jgi:capsular polysaccharide biosynthesis protein